MTLNRRLVQCRFLVQKLEETSPIYFLITKPICVSRTTTKARLEGAFKCNVLLLEVQESAICYYLKFNRVQWILNTVFQILFETSANFRFMNNDNNWIKVNLQTLIAMYYYF